MNYNPRQNSVIFISNLPKQKNAIAHLYKHFSRFGKIQAILQEKDNATIVFATPSQAEAAIESSLSYADNRFVRIKMHRCPLKSPVFLENAVNLEKVQNIATDTCVQINQKQLSIIMQKYKELERNDFDRDIRRLNNNRNALLEEASAMMVRMEGLQDEEKASLKKRILALSALIKQNDAQIKELEKMKAQHEST